MLEGPIVPALLKLAAPTLIVLVVQTLVSVAETYFVGFHESVPGTNRKSAHVRCDVGFRRGISRLVMLTLSSSGCETQSRL
jgi:hypothetical protein